MTVTVKEQVAVNPAASVAVDVTVVVPFGNVDPDAGLLITVTPGQLSEADTAKLTAAEQAPDAVFVVIFAGQVFVGG